MKSLCFLAFHKTNHRPSNQFSLKDCTFLLNWHHPNYLGWMNLNPISTTSLLLFSPKLRPRFPAGACHPNVSIQPGRSGTSKISMWICQIRILRDDQINKNKSEDCFGATTCLCLKPYENKNLITILHVVFIMLCEISALSLLSKRSHRSSSSWPRHCLRQTAWNTGGFILNIIEFWIDNQQIYDILVTLKFHGLN